MRLKETNTTIQNLDVMTPSNTKQKKDEIRQITTDHAKKTKNIGKFQQFYKDRN